MISYANAVAHELRTAVVQAEEKTSGVFGIGFSITSGLF